MRLVIAILCGVAFVVFVALATWRFLKTRAPDDLPGYWFSMGAFATFWGVIIAWVTG